MKPKVAAILIAVLGLVGLVDSGVLTYDHQAWLLDPAGQAGVCAEGSGCEISRTSRYSSVPVPGGRPRLPISLLGLACYAAVIGLAILRLRRIDNVDAARLHVLIGILSVVYSAFLAGVSLVQQGQFCPYCVVLYAVNVGILVVGLLSLPGGAREAVSKLGPAVVSRAGVTAAMVFLAALVGSYIVYAGPVAESRAARDKALVAEARLVGELPTVALSTTGRPTLGRPDAPVHIVEFADFQCPHCRTLFESLHDLLEARPEDVRVTLMHFPLDNACSPIMDRAFHGAACRLAFIAECAHRQGQFAAAAEWAFDVGAGSEPDLSREVLRRKAGDLGIDADRFVSCVETGEPRDAVVADIVAGAEAGVRATPTFFVNGRKVEGARPVTHLEAMVDGLLGRAP